MRKNISMNYQNSTIEVSNAFYKKACTFGTEEYTMLKAAMSQNPGFKLVIKTTEKKTYAKLTFKVMEEYIRTLADSEKQLVKFEAVKRIAKVKGGLYPITKHWFLESFPEYSVKSAGEDEIETALQSIMSEKADLTVMDIAQIEGNIQKAA